jgi:hypothetical protein
MNAFPETIGRDPADSANNPLLNPFPLTDVDRQRYRQLVAAGVFVSDHAPQAHVGGVFKDRLKTVALRDARRHPARAHRGGAERQGDCRARLPERDGRPRATVALRGRIQALPGPAGREDHSEELRPRPTAKRRAGLTIASDVNCLEGRLREVPRAGSAFSRGRFLRICRCGHSVRVALRADFILPMCLPMRS